MRKKQGRTANPRKVKRRNATVSTGNNSEVTRLGSALRALGGIGGGALGNLVGMGPQGSQAGTSMGAALSKWLGSGDYELSSNSVIVKAAAGVPMMHSSGQSIVVRHKEFIGDVLSGTGTPTSFSEAFAIPLNPGLETSFPWLSGIASQYQEYKWKGIVFHYVPTSGESVASTNTSLGTVMMSTNYRATDPAFTNKQQVLNEYFSSDAKPSETFIHPIECDPKENPYNILYVRTGEVPDGEDQKTYDLGVTRINTVGNPASGITLGELWVTYEIELKKPKPYDLDSYDSGLAHYYASGVVTGNYFGASRTKIIDTLGVTISSSVLTFPKGAYGTYLLLVASNTPYSTVTGFPTFTPVNCTIPTMNLGGGIGSILGTSYTAITTPVGRSTTGCLIRLTETGKVATVTVSGFSVTGGDGLSDIILTQISSAYI